MIVEALLWVWSDDKTLKDRLTTARKIAQRVLDLSEAPASPYQALGSSGIEVISFDFSSHAIDEDPAANAGTLVTDLIASAGGDRITDED